MSSLSWKKAFSRRISEPREMLFQRGVEPGRIGMAAPFSTFSAPGRRPWFRSPPKARFRRPRAHAVLGQLHGHFGPGRGLRGTIFDAGSTPERGQRAVMVPPAAVTLSTLFGRIRWGLAPEGSGVTGGRPGVRRPGRARPAFPAMPRFTRKARFRSFLDPLWYSHYESKVLS